MSRRVLVVEDGREYVEALSRLAGPDAPVRFERAGDLESARDALAAGGVDGLFLDVVFDRTPTERLAGDLPGLIDRFGGDAARAVRHLAENQGFYVLDALAPILPPGIPVVIAHDFASESQRFEALRRRVPGLVGLAEGASLAEAFRVLEGNQV